MGGQGDAQVHFAGARRAHHADDLAAGGASHLADERVAEGQAGFGGIGNHGTESCEIIDFRPVLHSANH